MGNEAFRFCFEKFKKQQKHGPARYDKWGLQGWIYWLWPEKCTSDNVQPDKDSKHNSKFYDVSELKQQSIKTKGPA